MLGFKKTAIQHAGLIVSRMKRRSGAQFSDGAVFEACAGDTPASRMFHDPEWPGGRRPPRLSVRAGGRLEIAERRPPVLGVQPRAPAGRLRTIA